MFSLFDLGMFEVLAPPWDFLSSPGGAGLLMLSIEVPGAPTSGRRGQAAWGEVAAVDNPQRGKVTSG